MMNKLVFGKLIIGCIVLLNLFTGCNNEKVAFNSFNNNWSPSPKNGAFKMTDYFVWGGSVIKADDGKYYMFASRWSSKTAMRAWVTNSEIVLAVSDNAEGPFKFEKVIFNERGREFWDGMMTHNPHIHYHDGKYILYYIGTTYDFEPPTDTAPTQLMYEEANNNQRVGIAVADSPYGPWERSDKPILEPREGKWDASITVNPAAVIHDDGSVLLIYKSAPIKYPERRKNRTMRFGVAKAKHYLGDYERVGEQNQISFKPVNTNVEDPYIWYDGKNYNLIAKCMNDTITGELHAGFFASSRNGVDWEIPENPVAYSRQVELDDGTNETMHLLERPQILFENGNPTHVFFGCRNSNWETFNLVRPLVQEKIK